MQLSLMVWQQRKQLPQMPLRPRLITLDGDAFFEPVCNAQAYMAIGMLVA